MPSMSSPPFEPDTQSHPRQFLTNRRTLLETVAVAVATLLVLIPYFHLPLSEADEGIIATGAERILRGQVTYRDFFSELGPASFYLQAMIFKFGAISVTALRLTAWLLGGAISGLIYSLARRLTSRAEALLAASVFALICYPSAYRVSHHWWANLFLLLTVLALATSFRRTSAVGASSEAEWLLLAGALCAVTLLTMQSKGIWALVVSVAFLFVEPVLRKHKERGITLRVGFRQTAWFLAGASIALGAVAAYFASRGALDAWLEDNFVFLLTNYRKYLDVPQASAYRTIIHLGRLALGQPSIHLLLYSGGYLFFLLIAPAIAFGGTAWQLLGKKFEQSVEARILLLILLESVGAFISEYHSPDVAHLMWAAPLTLILLVYQWSRWAAGGHLLGRLGKAAAVGAVVLMVFTAGRKAVNTIRINGRVETRRGAIYVRPSAEADACRIVEAVQQRVQAGGETFFFPYVAELYFLTATRNPARFDVLLPGFHTSAQFEETVASLKSARPEFVFSFDEVQRWTVRPHFPDDLPDIFTPHPVETALQAADSGYGITTTIESSHNIGMHNPPIMGQIKIWAAQR